MVAMEFGDLRVSLATKAIVVCEVSEVSQEKRGVEESGDFQG